MLTFADSLSLNRSFVKNNADYFISFTWNMFQTEFIYKYYFHYEFIT